MAKKKAAKKETAESGAVNKSAAIRDYKTANPEAGPKAIVEALSAQGIEVSAAQVSTTLSMAKKKMGVTPGKRGRKPRAVSSSNGNNGGKGIAAQLNAAVALIDACGSADAAKEVLAAVARLKSSTPF